MKATALILGGLAAIALAQSNNPGGAPAQPGQTQPGQQNQNGRVTDDENRIRFWECTTPGGDYTLLTYGTNSVALQWAYDAHAGRAIVCSAIDNLGKGAAGQAIQNANLMLGLPEQSGLAVNGVAP